MFKDLQKFLDGATNGAIYFSMGSYLKSKDLPVEKRNTFIKVFSRLKQRVIWKFEDESIPNLPKNLLIKAWMPQNDILAHPNVRLFITHGGLLGSTEALYHAKPVIGIPIFGDQRMNIQRAVRTGYGVLLDLNDVTEQTVQKAVEEVLTNPDYTDRARLISARYRDKPMSPKETAVFWIEYVIRHQGAPQIRSPAVDLTLLEYNLVDVYLTLAGLSCAIAALIYWAIKRLHRAVHKYWLEYNKKRD